MRRALGGLAAIPRHGGSFAPAQRLRAARLRVAGTRVGGTIAVSRRCSNNPGTSTSRRAFCVKATTARAKSTMPDDPVSGDEPMTGAQATHLKALAAEAREPEAFRVRLTRAEASRRIGALAAKLTLMDGPPHTL
jgi:Protein of unknown function (DUF3072)